MLKNHGFHVIDLGKDVSTGEIIAQAKAHKAEILALSALMTTTMAEMKTVVTSAREAGLTSKIIIGGAAVTAAYANEIGADGYAKDAAEAVRVVRNIVPNRS
jgi:5-methyltetrahydrofolate--homocysteine methyltransferase